MGSGVDNDLVVPFRGVSRQHARILVESGGILIEDLKSRNGTWVNGERIRRRRLQVGTRIRFGTGELVLEEAPADDVALALSIAPDLSQRFDRPEGCGHKAGTEFVTGRGLDSIPQALHLMSRLAELSLARESSSLAPALELASRVLGVQSACVFTIKPGEGPVVLATAGSVSYEKVSEFLRVTGRAHCREGPGLTVSVLTLPSHGLVTQVSLRSGTTPVCLHLALDGALSDFPGRDELLAAMLRFAEIRCQSEGRLGERTEATAAAETVPELSFPKGFVHGRSAAWNSVLTQLRLAISGGLPTLIIGETGVGKEWIARTFHASSRRSRGPFVPVNCAAIPSDLLEAEMFGVEKGAATDVSARQGRFQEADGGTLFLDEISELPLPLQAKLLRALQDSEVRPLGGPPKKVDLDVLAATNVDPWQKVQSGAFRADLYFRIAGAELGIPPLRERSSDIPVFVEHFLRRCAQRSGRLAAGVSMAAMNRLCHYSWPGNIRELESEMRRLAAACPPHGVIDEGALSPRILSSEDSSEDPLDLRAQVARLERSLISTALTQAGGSQRQASRILGVSRRGLSLKMKRLGILPPDRE